MARSADRFFDPAPLKSSLRAFLDDFQMQVGPAMAEDAHLLVEFVERDKRFKEIVASIASTAVDLDRAMRRGSSTRKQAETLQKRLVDLRSERQAVIARSACDGEFIRFKDDRRSEIEKDAALFQRHRELANRIRLILNRPRFPQLLRKALEASSGQFPSLAPDILSKTGKIEEFACLEELVGLLEQQTAAMPPDGKMLLMAPEPRPKVEGFAPISAEATGIEPNFFAGSVRLTVPPASPAGLAAEALGARRGRDFLFLDLGDNLKPASREVWKQFEPYLPFAAQEVIDPIIPECVPQTSPFSNFRELLSRECWRAIKDAIIAEKNNTCTICGMSASSQVQARWVYHEPLPGTDAYGVQELQEIHPCCGNCAAAVYPFSDSLINPVEVKGARPDAGKKWMIATSMKRLNKINRWLLCNATDALSEAVKRAEAAAKRRGHVRWALDLKALDGFNLILNKDLVMSPEGWIMREDELASHQSGTAVAVTRIFNAPFLTTSGMYFHVELPEVYYTDWVDSGPSDTVVRTSPAPSSRFVTASGPREADREDVLREEGPPAYLFA